MTIEKIINNKKMQYHHTSWTRGYVSRKNSAGIIETYKGKFGEGATIKKPSYESTQYCKIEYWIAK